MHTRTRMRRLWVAVLYSFFVFPFSLSAQDPVFRGLTADQFEVSDGGVRRVITQFSADRAPVSLAG